MAARRREAAGKAHMDIPALRFEQAKAALNLADAEASLANAPGFEQAQPFGYAPQRLLDGDQGEFVALAIGRPVNLD